jgi:arabinofuranosyltransferase
MSTTSDPAPASKRRPWLGWLACAPLLGWLAWQVAATHFLCDDAFIAFRYARNLVDGRGLVFNPGERVEGYTDFLWVLELAGLWRLGVRPEVAAPALSLALTTATLALVAALARRAVAPPRQLAATWIAVGLVACSPSFAVWSTSGLETRQFTFCVVAGAWLLARQPASAVHAFAASLAFGAAELTRPEGLLLFGVAVAWLLARERARHRLQLAHVLAFALPGAAIVAAHYLWRHDYYGEWLPNAYYAKHVRAWYDSGLRYLLAAAIELGAWLWVPLALLATAARAAVRDLTHVLPCALVAAHAVYLLPIGGDHFEYRPTDFYLPLLAAPAAAGVLQLAAWLARARHVLAFGLGAVAIVYAHAIGIASLAVALQRDEPLAGLAPRTRVDARTAPALRWLPGLLPMCEVLEPLRDELYRHLVAVPASVHRRIGRDLVAAYAACERLRDGVFPADAVASANAVGVMPFYLRGLTVIDVHGLTDATVARTPATADNSERRMAHDRHATAAYLRQRGVNLAVGSTAASERDALRGAEFALRIDGGAWLALQAADREWAQRALPPEQLASRQHVDSRRAEGNRVLVGGAAYDGVRLLATFEPDDAGLAWTYRGDVAVKPTPALLFGVAGEGALSTRAPADDADAASGGGSARSGEFVAAAGTSLVLFVAGERGVGLGVQLCRGEEVLRTFGPADRECLQPVVCALDAWAGAALHLEVHDAGPGWLALDHCLLARAADDARAPLSRDWDAPPPFGACVRIEPLHDGGAGVESGPTTIAITNPLPCGLHVRVRLVEGPAGAELLCGPWTLADGSAVDVLAPGATAHADAFVQLPAPVSLERQPLTLRVHAMPDLPGAALIHAPLEADLPLPSRAKN